MSDLSKITLILFQRDQPPKGKKWTTVKETRRRGIHPKMPQSHWTYQCISVRVLEIWLVSDIDLPSHHDKGEPLGWVWLYPPMLRPTFCKNVNTVFFFLLLVCFFFHLLKLFTVSSWFTWIFLKSRIVYFFFLLLS